MLKKVKGQLISIFAESIYYLSKLKKKQFDVDLKFDNIKQFYPDRNDQYDYCHHYFWNKAPHWLRKHREYFKIDQRGFGEDAFHAMWYFIFREFSPEIALEIGVYRGQVISLWALLARKMGIVTEIHGISPFSTVGDEVSRYLNGIDYYEDVLLNFNKFDLAPAHLYKGYSTDEAMINIIKSRAWDLVYIDGNHNYEIAIQDFLNCWDSVRINGLIILDDSSLFTKYNPPIYSSAGHPGPSKIANELDPKDFMEIMSVGHNRVFQKLRDRL